MAQRRLGGRGVGQGLDHRAGLAGGPAQDGVDEAGAGARLALGELDGLGDRGVRGHAVQERQLEHAEPQRAEHGGLELGQRPARERHDHVVERVPPLHDAVGEPHGQRAVAGAQVQSPRLAVQRAVRVGALLEHAARDCERAHPCGRDPIGA